MPSIEANPIQVISLIAVFNSNKEVLLLKRDDQAHCGGLWSFPGGKVEAHEMPLDTAIRELKEETGLSGKLWRHLGKSSHTYDDRTLNFLFFVCLCPNTSTLHTESEHQWIELENIAQFNMPEANAKLLPLLFIPEMNNYLVRENDPK